MLRLPRPHRVVLSSGATLLYQKNPISPSAAFGVYLTRGSRDEGASERGFSHLLEHTVFRGTAGRSALEIALELESIGGQWDAFTGKEVTCYHGRAVEEHVTALADVFADIVLHPSIPPDAFRLEQKIVREEIRSIRDAPDEMVHELFFRTVFKDHPLGVPVAGFQSDIARCSREDLLSFHRKTYAAGNALIGFVGNIPLPRVVRTLENLFVFRRRRGGRNGGPPTDSPGRMQTLRRSDWTQSHVVIGCRGVHASHPSRHAMLILANLLGGGVSSRLFQSLRERTGLAYSVMANAHFWRDTGVLYTYFSVDPKKLPRALEIVRAEFESLRNGDITGEELASVKAQLKGVVILGLESVESRLFRLFHGEVYHGGYQPYMRTVGRIDAVTASAVADAAAAFLDEDRLTYVTCGPVSLRRFVPAARSKSFAAIAGRRA